MSASATAAARWGVSTVTAAMFDVVVHASGRYVDRCRCSSPEEAERIAMRTTYGKRRSVAVIWSPHLGTTMTVSGNRSEVPAP